MCWWGEGQGGSGLKSQPQFHPDELKTDHPLKNLMKLLKTVARVKFIYMSPGVENNSLSPCFKKPHYRINMSALKTVVNIDPMSNSLSVCQQHLTISEWQMRGILN